MTEQMTMAQARDWHVCGLVVQGNPNKIEAIQQALLAMPHTEIPVLDATKGKFVVVMQSHDKHLLHAQMEATRDIEGVIDVSLVYHQQDEHE